LRASAAASFSAQSARAYYDHLLANPGQCEAAATLFPDRAVHRREELHTLLADRLPA
jgi:hypothetical protein